MQVRGQISRGGFGRVERVRLDDGTDAARKVFDPLPEILRAANVDKLRKRFEREVRVQVALSSDFVVPVLQSELTGANPWFVMPLADKNLNEEIIAARTRGEVATKALADILNGLEYLHALGYVHRDLKPANVLFHENRWKLSDFGLVLPTSGTTTALTSTYSAWGTADYCAPEQAQDFRNATPAVDIYAFGCILHDLVVGSPRIPYRQQSAQGPIGYIIEKCTEPNPRRRFKTVAALRGALLAELARNIHLASDPSADEWAAALDQIPSWDARRFEEFVRFLRRVQDENIAAWSVFLILDEDFLRLLHDKDAELWSAVADFYCDYSRSSFDFGYCDVVVRRLETIFELGNLAEKASAVVAAAILGQAHNRWFVMGRVLHVCGPSLDDVVAERIAIEIQVEATQEEFISCARSIGQDIDSYHPRIVEVLRS